jgi:hypothetical protein
MIFTNNKEKGRAGMALGIAYFGANGYTVNIPLNDTQWYDFVAEKDGNFYTVQCKATGSAAKEISLKSCGGTAGTVYDNVTEHPLDYLFCVDSEQNLFCIPMEVILQAGNKKSITLRTEPISIYANKNCIDTSKYFVKI